MALNERNERSIMEELPTETMVHILDFADIPTRLQLARCNLSLQRRVYHECQQAWLVVDFSHIKDTSRECLTDEQLSRLLVRFDARNVTRKLNLESCSDIYGSGLAPLRHSRVLEQVVLRGTFAKYRPDPFLWILLTMFPYELFEVSLDYQVTGYHTSSFPYYFFDQLTRNETRTRQGTRHLVRELPRVCGGYITECMRLLWTSLIALFLVQTGLL